LPHISGQLGRGKLLWVGESCLTLQVAYPSLWAGNLEGGKATWRVRGSNTPYPPSCLPLPLGRQLGGGKGNLEATFPLPQRGGVRRGEG